MSAISERIMYIRKKALLSQAAFAKRIGVTQGAVSQWEHDITKPSYDQISAISKEFDVTVDYLLDLTNNPHGEQEVTIEPYEPTDAELMKIPSIAMMAREMGQMTEAQRQQMLKIGKTLMKEFFNIEPEE